MILVLRIKHANHNLNICVIFYVNYWDTFIRIVNQVLFNQKILQSFQKKDKGQNINLEVIIPFHYINVIVNIMITKKEIRFY